MDGWSPNAMLARPAGDKNAMLARPGVADPGGSGWGAQIGCGLCLLRIEKNGPLYGP